MSISSSDVVHPDAITGLGTLPALCCLHYRLLVWGKLRPVREGGPEEDIRAEYDRIAEAAMQTRSMQEQVR
jgi:hypothetical protein